ncbi:PREDICTED: sodium/hydrogen exchanger 2-like isoform X2 [Camelina sativa]|uniref:Sodium/hydrogen exchanger 2-like isoform X2 n=1 Tax=Camelina sativa TaxID=90675 RepID=A0ABM1RCT5_CAMSA|nr:PREDICTED: sodium/hydrogen exchanger 2-like isoform X2 [Camelina sativa]
MAIGLSTMLKKTETMLGSDHASVVSMNLFVALLCACIVLGHLLEETRWMNESITALIIGSCTGIVILLISGGKSSRILVFSEDLFFIYLLPPIIFNAGFQVKKKQFFRNFTTIMFFGAIGTLISFVIISLGAKHFFEKMNIGDLTISDYLAIGAIFSATDSVCTLQAGLLSAFIMKKLYIGRHSTDREVALMMLLAYLSYMLAELFHLSSILTVFFCGIVMSHYTWHNVTDKSKVTTKHTFAALSFLAEIFIFLYVGMDALDIRKWDVVRDSPGQSIGVSSILLGLILLGRAAFVFPLSFLSNLTKSPDEKLDWKKQVTIWWAGLMRGAVSMALAYNQFTTSGHTKVLGNAIMITSTITVVLFSTVVFGLLTKPLVKHLHPSSKRSSTTALQITPGSSLQEPLLNGDSIYDPYYDHIDQSITFRMFLKTPSRAIHHYWRKFDNAVMRRIFGGRGVSPVVPGSPVETSIRQWSEGVEIKEQNGEP